MTHNIVDINIKWQQQYIAQVKDILITNAMHLISIQDASIEDDKHRATDLVVHIKGGDVAVRIRRPDCDYRDWTIRSIIPQGKTELAKLREGFGDWYLYCWTNNDNKINEWIFINLKRVRDNKLLDVARSDIPNGDGTYFRQISIIELMNSKCLISYNCLE